MQRDELVIERMDDELTRRFGLYSGNGITRFDPDEEREIYQYMYGYVPNSGRDGK